MREDESLDGLETFAVSKMREHQDDLLMADQQAEKSVMLTEVAAAKMERERELHWVIEADIRRGMEEEIRRRVEHETQALTAEVLKVKLRVTTARAR